MMRLQASGHRNSLRGEEFDDTMDLRNQEGPPLMHLVYG